MVFKKVESNSYAVDLIRPFKNSKTEILSRVGNIVQLYVDNQCGCGEAAPLSPYSKESLPEISWALEELKIALDNNSNYSKDDMLDLFELYSKGIPSLHFALDISLYDILAQKEKISLAKFLNPNNFDQVKFSSIYNGKINKSFKVIKVKFGLKHIDKEIEKLNILSEKYGDNIKFRIDANQAYSIDNFIYLCNKLKNINIEYIEEPLLTINKENLKIIKDNSNLPIAIDESIFQYNYRELVESKLIDYAIIKPSLYGGIKSIFKLVQYLKKYNIKIILSSGLHTIIGNLANIHIASALESINHHGLNNYPFFHLDKKAPYGPNDSMINVNDLVGLGVCNDD